MYSVLTTSFHSVGSSLIGSKPCAAELEYVVLQPNFGAQRFGTIMKLYPGLPKIIRYLLKHAVTEKTKVINGGNYNTGLDTCRQKKEIT
jgi:hypothetical protein